ncbi:MAG: hypothetical protein ACLRVT_01475 [Oscillospiraceae bacterium]
MKKDYLWLSSFALLLLSGTTLVDRFIVPIPDWLAIILLVIALCAFVVFLIANKKHTK